MKNVAVIGASGYTGAELARLLMRHPRVRLQGLYVSADSRDGGARLDRLHGSLLGTCPLSLEPLTDPMRLAGTADAVFLATEHRVSHDLAAVLTDGGCTVFDLSGAFRVRDADFYPRHYGFAHEHPRLLAEAVYALPEHVSADELQRARLISLPGCYPTAAQLALRPLLERQLLDPGSVPVINAVSGVSGAGRRASLTSSFCEVSLNAYGIFTHRHQPEIESHLGQRVIFNPHLGSFKRGILATITARLRHGTADAAPAQALSEAYAGRPLIRLPEGWPRVDDVARTPYCDLHCATGHDHVVICSALDNLLKGASSQAVQAMNLHYGFEETAGLL